MKVTLIEVGFGYDGNPFEEAEVYVPNRGRLEVEIRHRCQRLVSTFESTQKQLGSLNLKRLAVRTAKKKLDPAQAGMVGSRTNRD